MPALAADEATLSELLEVLGEPLREQDLWAVLTGSCLALSDNLISGPLRDGVHFVTPQTLVLCREGTVRFAVKTYVREDPRCTPPESYSRENVRISSTEMEKMLMYSLGVVIYIASTFMDKDSHANLKLSRDLETLLVGMCEDNPGRRLSLKEVFPVSKFFCNMDDSAARISALVRIIVGNVLPLNKGKPSHVIHDFGISAPSHELSDPRRLPALRSVRSLDALESQQGLSETISPRRGVLKHTNSHPNSLEKSGASDATLAWRSFNGQVEGQSKRSNGKETSVTLDGSLTDFTALMELEQRKMREQGFLSEADVRGSYDTGNNSFVENGSPATYQNVLKNGRGRGDSERELSSKVRQAATDSKVPSRKRTGQGSVSSGSLGETGSLANSDYSSTISLNFGTYNMDITSDKWPSRSNSIGSRSRLSEDVQSLASSKLRSSTRNKEESGPEFHLITSDIGKSVVDITPPLLGPSPKGQRRLTVILPNLQRLEAQLPMTSKVKGVMDLIAQHLLLKEASYFGLAQVRDGEHFFLDPDTKLVKHAPPGWKDAGRKIDFILWFKVQFFIENLVFLRHFTTRHLHYLHLRRDLLKDYTHCEEDKALQLAGLALQAEYGDYDSNYHGKSYFQTEHCVPARIINRLQRNEIVTRLLDSHTSCRGLSQDQAESQYLRECQKLPEYGVLFYRVSRSKKEEEDNVLLGICINGIIVYEIKGSMKIPIHKQPWSLTKEFSFRGKRFSIKPVKDMYAPKMTFFTNQDKKSKYLLSICKAFHRFHAFNNLRKYGNHPSLESSFSRGDYEAELRSRPSSRTSKIESKSDAKTTPKQNRSQREIEEDAVKEKAVALTSSQRSKRRLSVDGSSDEELEPSPNPRRRLSTLEGVPDRKILIARLVKEKDQGLGITIVGGEDSKCLNQGIYIKTITPGGVVARDGRLQRGDRILAVNNTSLECVTHDEAVDILKKVTGKCEIIVSQIQNGDSALDSAGLCSSDFGHEVVEPDVLEEKFFGNLRVVHPPSLRQKDEKRDSENVFLDDAADETDFICEESPYASVSVAEREPSTTSMASAVVTKVNAPRLQLELTKKAGSLGFIINGGRDSAIPGGHVVISELIPGGAAELNGNIKLGDQIVEVNGISLEDVYHKQAVEILKHAPMKTRLVLERPADPTVFLPHDNSSVRPHDAVILSGTDMMDGQERANIESNTYSVLLEKKNGGLGLSIAGGLGSSPAFEDKIFVRKMFPGQPADSSKEIKVGDVILHVNGEGVTGRSKAEVVQMLRNATCPVMLRLQRTEPYELPQEILDETASPPTTPDQILAKVQTKIQHITKQYSVPLSVERKKANVEALYATVSKEKKTNRQTNVKKQLSEGASSSRSPRQLSPLAVVISAKANYASEEPTCRSRYAISVESSPCTPRKIITNEGLSSPEAIEDQETSDIIFQSPSDLDDDTSNDGKDSEDSRCSPLQRKNWTDQPVAQGISGVKPESPYASIGSLLRKEENVAERPGRKTGPGTVSKPALHEEPIVPSRLNELNVSAEYALNLNDLVQSPDLPEPVQPLQARDWDDVDCERTEPPYAALRLPTPEPSPKRQETKPEGMLGSSPENAFDDSTPLRLPTTAGLASSSSKDTKFPVRPASIDETDSTPRFEGNLAHDLGIESKVSNTHSDMKFRTIDVTLERSPSGLGFTVAGGFSTTGGCFIREVVADPALSKGSIKSGDQLVQVNGQDMTQLDHSDAIDVLRNCGRYVHLVLRRKRFRGSRRRAGKNTRSVILTRNSRGRFGLLLGEESGYIIVQDLVPNEPADRDGGLRHGDRILEINDQTTFSLSLQEARELMNSSGPQLYLVVEKTKHEIESRYHVPEKNGSFQLSVDDEQDTGPSAPQVPKELSMPDTEVESPSLDAVNSLHPMEAKVERPNSSDSDVSFSSIGSPVLKRLDCRSDQNLADVSWISSSAEEKGHIICVQIEKGPSGLGMSLETKDLEDGDTGVFIKSLDVKGTASKNGQLRPGDRLIGINGRNVEHMNQMDIISFLRSIPSVVSLEVFRMPRNISFRKRSTQVCSSRPVSMPSVGLGSRAISLETSSTKDPGSSDLRKDRSKSMEELECFPSRDVATAVPLSSIDLAISLNEPGSSFKTNVENSSSKATPTPNTTLHINHNIEEEESTTSFGNTDQKLKLHRQDSLDGDRNPDNSNFTNFVLQSEGIVLPDGMELADLNIPIEISKSDYTGSDVASERSAVSLGSKRSEERVHNLLNKLPVSDNSDTRPLYELRDMIEVKDDRRIIETSFAGDSPVSGSDVTIPSQESSPLESTGFSPIDREGSATPSNSGTTPLSDVDSNIKKRGPTRADLDSLAQQLSAKLKCKKVDSEYQEIRKMKSWGTSRVGKRAYNKSKNRPKAPIPYDENRVCLTGGEEVDYINASLVKVDAEGQSYSFIAAQGPLNNTYEDFWKMVFENRVEVIVMVTNDVENGKNKCHRYWPEIPGLPMKVLDRWSIEIANVTQRGNAIMRELIAKNSKTGKTVGLLHCWYKTLPEGLGLKNMRSFAQFVGDVAKIELTGPCVVHCSGGGERTGAFILAYVIYQNLLAGILPNISHIAKRVAKQRSGLVQSKEQYQLFYKLAVEIVDMLNEAI